MDENLYTYKATCLRVVDGDTLELRVSVGFKLYFEERFRLLNINTAEIYGVKKDSEEYAKGVLSTNRVKELVMEKDLIIKTYKDKKGKYGRYLCEIFVDDQNVGEFLIKEGLVEYKEY